jgi:putative ATPase
MKELGYGRGYQYAHDSPDAYLPQEYLPDALRGAAFYVPGPFGHEKRVAERMEWWARKRADGEQGDPETPQGPSEPEEGSTSGGDR